MIGLLIPNTVSGGVNYAISSNDILQDKFLDEIKLNPKDRAIVRGTMPKTKSKAGRPRKIN